MDDKRIQEIREFYSLLSGTRQQMNDKDIIDTLEGMVGELLAHIDASSQPAEPPEPADPEEPTDPDNQTS